MPDPVPVNAGSLVPSSYRLLNLQKIYTSNGEPCQVEVHLEVMVNDTPREIFITIEPGTLAQMGYENPTEAFNTGFNQIPDLQYGEPVLQAVQDWMFGFTNPNVLIEMMCEKVL